VALVTRQNFFFEPATSGAVFLEPPCYQFGLDTQFFILIDGNLKRPKIKNKKLEDYEQSNSKKRKIDEVESPLEIGDRVILLSDKKSDKGKRVGTAVICDVDPKGKWQSKAIGKDNCVLIPGTCSKNQQDLITTLQFTMHKKVKWPVNMIKKVAIKESETDSGNESE